LIAGTLRSAMHPQRSRLILSAWFALSTCFQEFTEPATLRPSERRKARGMTVDPQGFRRVRPSSVLRRNPSEETASDEDGLKCAHRVSVLEVVHQIPANGELPPRLPRNAHPFIKANYSEFRT